jgi:4-hydroxybenzoate polyprenyltransferase
MGLVSGMLISQILLLILLGTDVLWAYTIALISTYALAIKQVFSFVRGPSLKGREKNEAAIAINMLVGYLVIIIAVLVNNGIAWSII